MFRVIPSLKSYDWGSKDKNSIVGILSSKNDLSNDSVNTFAELWMGDHVMGPLRISKDQVYRITADDLDEELSEYKENPRLPFLFKVLSVERPLSIQVHPNKEEAAKLHLSNPTDYPDDNHKPEMMISLSKFELLAGFSFSAMKNIKNVPELHFLLTNDSTVESCFKTLLRLPEIETKRLTRTIFERLDRKSKQQQTNDEESMFLKLFQFYPEDVGTLCSFFLNHLVLEAGTSIFISSGLPHAYLSGSCIECMANSDNVVRAGLTTKKKDIETLLKILDYNCQLPRFIDPVEIKQKDSKVILYRPPCKEFKLEEITVCGELTLNVWNGPSILLVMEGHLTCQTLVEGDLQTLDLEIGNVVIITRNKITKLSGNGKAFRCS
jgi:mannose-6-phosphate isomerase